MEAENLEEKVRQAGLDGATDEEICEIHGMTTLSLKERFGKVLRESRAKRRIALRKLQNKAAMKGSAGILSLLGKHELGQDGKQRASVYRWPEPQLDPKVG